MWSWKFFLLYLVLYTEIFFFRTMNNIPIISTMRKKTKKLRSLQLKKGKNRQLKIDVNLPNVKKRKRIIVLSWSQIRQHQEYTCLVSPEQVFDLILFVVKQLCIKYLSSKISIRLVISSCRKETLQIAMSWRKAYQKFL